MATVVIMTRAVVVQDSQSLQCISKVLNIDLPSIRWVKDRT